MKVSCGAAFRFCFFGVVLVSPSRSVKMVLLGFLLLLVVLPSSPSPFVGGAAFSSFFLPVLLWAVLHSRPSLLWCSFLPPHLGGAAVPLFIVHAKTTQKPHSLLYFNNLSFANFLILKI